MYKKDLRYIIRRVIITLVVGSIFYLFRTLTANALEVTDLDINGAYNVGSTYSFNLTYMNNPTSYMFDFPNNFTDSTTNYIVFQYSDSIMNEQEISFNPSGSYNFNLFLNGINFGTELFFTDGNSVLCDRKLGYIICQRPLNKTLDKVRFNFLGALVPNGSLAGVSGDQLTHYTMYISNWIILYKNKPDNSSSIIANNNQNTQSIINGQQQQTQDIINSQQQQTQDIINSQQQINDSINDSTIDTGGGAGHYFGDDEFKKEYGLSDFVLIPINFIRNITSSTCNPITIPLPFTNDNFVLPCMQSILSDRFSNFIKLYQVIISGVIAFRCIIGTYHDIEKALDPEQRMEITEMFT